MRLEVVKVVRRLPDEVYAWCTDYRESDPGLSSVSIRERRVTSHGKDTVGLEDDGILGMRLSARYAVRLHPPDRWEADSVSRMGTGHNEYRLTPVDGGTRIAMAFDLRPRGLYRIPGAFARWFLQRRLSRLWDDLVRAMEEGR